MSVNTNAIINQSPIRRNSEIKSLKRQADFLVPKIAQINTFVPLNLEDIYSVINRKVLHEFESKPISQISRKFDIYNQI